MADRKPGFNEQFCPSCGAIANERAPYCPDCGHPISPENEPGGAGSESGDVDIGYETIDERRQRQKEKAKEIGDSIIQESDSVAPAVKSVSLWAVGLFFLLGGVGSLTSPGLSPVVGIPLAAVGVVLLPPVHGLVGRDADPLAFGSRGVVEESSVSSATEPCAACAGRVENGVERKRVKQFLVFGGAISSNDEGRLVYCQDCARGRVEHTKGEQPAVSDETQERSGRESEQTTVVGDSGIGTDETE